MSGQTQKQLGSTLWNIADQLRGAMDADDFRDYMLSFLFLRYLSDNYETAAKKELGPDYPKLEGDGPRVPLAVWYANNPDDVAEFEKQMRRKVHYVIKPDYLWTSIAHLARRQDGELLNTLQAGFKYIENDSFQSTFQGLFSEIDLASPKLGRTYPERNAKLCTIIQKIAEGLAEFSTDSDTLGDAYEYLIGQFAAGSGKKAGEFYTPQQLSDILPAIVTLDSQERRVQGGLPVTCYQPCESNKPPSRPAVCQPEFRGFASGEKSVRVGIGRRIPRMAPCWRTAAVLIATAPTNRPLVNLTYRVATRRCQWRPKFS